MSYNPMELLGGIITGIGTIKILLNMLPSPDKMGKILANSDNNIGTRVTKTIIKATKNTSEHLTRISDNKVPKKVSKKIKAPQKHVVGYYDPLYTHVLKHYDPATGKSISPPLSYDEAIRAKQRTNQTSREVIERYKTAHPAQYQELGARLKTWGGPGL